MRQPLYNQPKQKKSYPRIVFRSSSGVVMGAYAIVMHYAGDLSGFWNSLLGVSLLPLSQVWYWLLGGFAAFGILIGSLGTATSIHKYLEV